MENAADASELVDKLPLEPEFCPPKLSQGKDEMNLAEFPISAIAERVDPDQKTLFFEDRIWDDSRGEMITRKLTVTASNQYGLPTALDDEVILGLVQLSKIQGFADRRVQFTRYQLIRLLGWRDDSQSYERIEQSLNRWVGVTLYYENAWRDKKNGSWVDEKFHLIDNVTLYDREKAAKARVRESDGGKQTALALSSFTWNDVLFRSFSAGNLKSLDFDFYKSLHSAIAKRLFRFLDKRFFHRARWEFNLKEVSWEHIGLSRNYDAANIKRKLRPAIKELETKGFLQPLSEAERFQRVKSGEWRVVFERSRPRRASQPVEPPAVSDSDSPLVRALMQRGVTDSTARETVASHDAERIQSQLEVFDWLVANNDPKVSRNPAGFLVMSIKGEYVAPKGFVTREELKRREDQAFERKRKAAEREAQLKAEAEAKERAKEGAIKSFWTSLSEEERSRLEREAITKASRIQRDLIARGGALADAARKSVLDSYALNVLQQAA